MVANIACYSPACQRTVIGQCAGYNKPCGRFYCAIHSGYALCSECAERKAREEALEAKYHEYVKVASNIANSGPDGLLIFGLLIFVGGPLLGGWEYLVSHVASLDTYRVQLFVLAVGIMLTVMFWAVRGSYRRVKREIEEAAQNRIGFEQFYTAWRNGNGRQWLEANLAVILTKEAIEKLR